MRWISTCYMKVYTVKDLRLAPLRSLAVMTIWLGGTLFVFPLVCFFCDWRLSVQGWYHKGHYYFIACHPKLTDTFHIIIIVSQEGEIFLWYQLWPFNISQWKTYQSEFNMSTSHKDVHIPCSYFSYWCESACMRVCARGCVASVPMMKDLSCVLNSGVQEDE